MTIHAKPLYHKDSSGTQTMNQLTLILDSKGIETFKKVLDRALNCWPDCPNEFKSLSDKLNHGTVLQPYHVMYPEQN